MNKIMNGVTALAMAACLIVAPACAKAEAAWEPSGQGDPDVLLAKDLLSKTVQVEVHHIVDVKLTRTGVNPEKAKLVNALLEDDEDKDDEGKDDDKVEDGTQVIKGEDIGGLGSGYVAAQQDVRSLIVTASHVCHTWEGTKTEEYDSWFGGKIKVELTTVSADITVISNTGEKYKAVVIEDDTKNDVCVMDVDGTVGLTLAETAETTPAAGAALLHTGAPAGLWGVNAGAFVHGNSMGVLQAWPSTTEESGQFLGMMLVSNGGSSGGPVWYRGQVVGILVRGGGGITLAVEAEYVQAAITKAKVEWRKKTAH